MPWGSVSYKIADLGFVDSVAADGWLMDNTISELMNTYMERIVGDDSFEFYGLQFPVMVKEISTDAWQPLQVCADDKAAEERYDSLGKKMLWLVLEADEDAKLRIGFRSDVTPAEFFSKCKDGSVSDLLNEVSPAAGDAFLIKPGTVFSAGPGLKILEISESFDPAFNLFFWPGLADTEPGADEDFLEEVFDLIDFSGSVPSPVREGVLAAEPEFKVTRMELKDPLRVFSDQPISFAVYCCVQGEAVVELPSEDGKSMESFRLRPGTPLLVPAELTEFYIVPAERDTALLEILSEKREIPDSYLQGR